MRPSQKLLLLDTGVKRHLCISKNPPIEHEDAWDRLIAASEQLIQISGGLRTNKYSHIPLGIYWLRWTRRRALCK